MITLLQATEPWGMAEYLEHFVQNGWALSALFALVIGFMAKRMMKMHDAADAERKEMIRELKERKDSDES